MRARNQRKRRGSQVKIVVIVPDCHDAPTNDAPITSPISITMKPAACRYSGSSRSCRRSPDRKKSTCAKFSRQ